MNAAARWVVTWSTWDTWVLVVLVAAVLWGAWRDRRARLALWWVSAGLRLATVAWVAAALAGAELWHETTARRPGRFLLAEDRSASVVLRPQVAAALDQAAARTAAALGEAGQVERLAYVGRSATPVWQPLTTAVSGGPTRLAEDLARLPEAAIDGASGIVLYTDGIDPSVAYAAPLTLPLSAVVLAQPQEPRRPLWLADVATDAYALVRSPLRFRVVVGRGAGAPATALVRILSRGTTLAATAVTFAPGAATAAVSLDVLPTQEGYQIFAVEIDDRGAAVDPDLQRSRVAVRVIRDRTRVLHVVGRPDWETRLLRESLRGDATVDLVSFQILRTREDNPAASEDDLSLIPFPTKELFSTELAKFDVVIFQNFDYRPYFEPAFRFQLLENLRRFVLDDGGGFLMTAGDLSFGFAGYQRTPLADVLPVVWDGFGTWLPTTPRLGPWAAWFEAPLPRHAAAIDRVYATDPVAGARSVWQAGEHPLVVVARRGQGRSAAVLSDRLWRAATLGDGADLAAIAQLWSRLVRYLSGDPAFEDLHVRWADGRAAPGALVRGRVEPASAGRVALVDEAGRELTRATLNADGEFAAQLPNTAATLSLRLGERTAPEPLIVELPLEERTGTYRDDDAWRAWANAHGALLASPDDIDVVVQRLEANTRRVVERRVQPLLDLWVYWLVGLGLLLGDLSIRRLSGVP